MLKQNVKLYMLCLAAMMTFSMTLISCTEKEPDACEDINYDESEGTVTFNGDELRLVEGSSYNSFPGLQTAFSVSFISDDCETQYAIILQLLGTVETSYDLATLATGTSSIVYTDRDPVSVDTQGLKSGTLNLEDKGDGVWNIDIDGIDQSDAVVKFQVEYDFE